MAIPAHYARDCRVSCARAYRHTRRRAGACYARVLVARVGGAGFGLPAFWWVLRAVWCGCPLPFSAVVVGGCTRSRSLAHGLPIAEKPAHGSRLAGVRLLAVVSVSAVVSVRKSYLFSVDNICRMVGGILQPNGNRKTANSMCPLTLTPTNFSQNTEHIRSVGSFGNLPNSGGEFRNRNHGFLL